uniref:PiggyBac transposable element-derived protein 4-like n=1 Tax=Stegastes partitus TaxID=144197 RepID=A0A3B5AMD5_9TELE
MAVQGPISGHSTVEVLRMLEEDDGSLACALDSSSDDEDLLGPAQDNGDDVDYVLPSTAVTPQSGPSTPSSTIKKNKRSSLGTSPATKRRKQLFAPIEDDEDEWHNKEEEDSKPELPKFMPARTPGPTFHTTAAWSPLSLFQLFFSASVVQKVIDNTNANAARRRKAGLKFKWETLTVKEFYTFLAILLFSGLVSVRHRSDYWRKRWPYNFSFPGDQMSRDRLEAIIWSLHLSDPKDDEENDKKKGTPEYDRLFKLKPLYTEIVNACKAHFQPYRNLSIDERMVGSKARISMKQYMKNKPTKWGYKLFVLADSLTGYTWNFFIYTGKSESPTTRGLSYSAVIDLLPLPLLGSGYNLFTDNYYTSPALFNDLSEKNIACCGTIRQHHTGFPQNRTNDLPKKAERGDIRWIRDGKLLFVKWMDTREVAMCSTMHQAYSGLTVKRKVKEAGEWKNKLIPVPDSIIDYNRNMGGVDLSDALMTYYNISHKTMKWYKTLFYHFVEIATVNSFLLHKELFKLRKDPTQTKPFTQKTYREQLAQEMLEFAKGSAAIPPAPSTSCMPIFLDNQENRARRYCKRCHDAERPRVKTPVICRRCKVPLCLSAKRNCFQLWHDGDIQENSDGTDGHKCAKM